ncbi:efflux transporter outer membrane subunit [Pectobacterium atrosepticum]|uniref:efflux transporter outer membrane subunit n=1 Tax=Pectobacterium atrosepticum TaxID=29471 RepID=UPI00049AAD33|nr:efflux transporter outer membrane subunit [Pectobacterium atrosepticum]AIA72242.1 multidrug transporter [Pectobacterium atrosepticum]AIK15213.1 multidrug resistance outer membrane protein [Pectobacterium atrosepticum]KFX20575.1 multidrug transporter [Pectobacterium atrosepticum]POW23645.1 multidrug transporter [Pectobacterium atrosepticum]
MITPHKLSLIAVTLLLAGCSMAPTYTTPPSPITEQWKSDRHSSATTDWKTFIQDERLRHLVDMALANNRDLRQTLLNVDVARAQYRIQRADRLPGIEAQGSGSRQRVPGDISPTGQAAVQSEWRSGVGLAAFELDLFGRVKSLSDAAMEEYLATENNARGARITLIAEVVQAYLTRNGAAQRYELTNSTLQSRQDSLRLISERRAVGVASALDYQEALGLVEQVRAEREQVTRQLRQSENALRLLVGTNDIDRYLPQKSVAEEAILQNIAPGTPSQLLAYRPDIEAAENRLKSRNASIGAARAAFFPRISLTGMYGSASTELSDLFSSGQQAWSFSPQITLPLFSGGSNMANLDVANLRKDIAVADYEKTIQTAFREVSDALDATDTLRREALAQESLTKTNLESLRLAEARYAGGVDGHLRYLDAQRRAFGSQIQLIDIRTQHQVALSTLYRALGGGWHEENRQEH